RDRRRGCDRVHRHESPHHGGLGHVRPETHVGCRIAYKNCWPLGMKCTLSFDGRPLTGPADQPLIDFLAAQGIDLPHVCYHRALGPLQTCDVCWVEAGGELVRGCTLRSREGLEVTSRSARAAGAREEGMDRLLAKHELYCTVCENNTGDCTLHNTFADMEIPIQRYAFRRKPYAKDHSSPFYTYDPD